MANQFVLTYMTSFVDNLNGSIIGLTYLNVLCPNNFALIDFNMTFPLGSLSQYSYIYRCIQVSSTNNILFFNTTPSNLYSGPNYYNSTQLLNQHNITCPLNYGIQQFILANVTNTTVQYNYTCIQSSSFYSCSSGSLSSSIGSDNNNLALSYFLGNQTFIPNNNYPVLRNLKLNVTYLNNNSINIPYYSYLFDVCRVFI